VIEYGSRGTAIAKDMYLTGARACEADGFVPTDWYACTFIIENFNERFPNYQAASDLKPERWGSERFRARTLVDRSGPVALVDVDDIDSINAVGGNIPIPPGFTSFSIPGIKALLGARLTDPVNTLMP